jgi:hypothetical protein
MIFTARRVYLPLCSRPQISGAAQAYLHGLSYTLVPNKPGSLFAASWLRVAASDPTLETGDRRKMFAFKHEYSSNSR